MTQVILDHGVSGYFGTRLGTSRGAVGLVLVNGDSGMSRRTSLVKKWVGERWETNLERGTT